MKSDLPPAAFRLFFEICRCADQGTVLPLTEENEPEINELVEAGLVELTVQPLYRTEIQPEALNQLGTTEAGCGPERARSKASHPLVSGNAPAAILPQR